MCQNDTELERTPKLATRQERASSKGEEISGRRGLTGEEFVFVRNDLDQLPLLVRSHLLPLSLLELVDEVLQPGVVPLAAAHVGAHHEIDLRLDLVKLLLLHLVLDLLHLLDLVLQVIQRERGLRDREAAVT